MMPVCTVCVNYTADVTSFRRPMMSAMQVAWTDNILYINHEQHTQVREDEITPTTANFGTTCVRT